MNEQPTLDKTCSMWRTMPSVLVFIVGAITACSGQQSTSSVTGETTPELGQTIFRPMPEERTQRWRWQGSRESCFFVHDNNCFKTRKDACTSAGCGEKSCTIEGAGPAVVSCP